MGQFTGKVSEEMLAELTRRLVSEFDPEQIILFGSQAWGTPGEDSDVDLYVIVSESAEKPWRRMVRAQNCIGSVMITTDILVKTRAETEAYKAVPATLTHKVFTEGRVLYERREE
jgi:predicted nucleotidyltransferase